jgi:hypothetical protein
VDFYRAEGNDPTTRLDPSGLVAIGVNALPTGFALVGRFALAPWLKIFTTDPAFRLQALTQAFSDLDTSPGNTQRLIALIELIPRPITYPEYELLEPLAYGLKAGDIDLFGSAGLYKQAVQAARDVIHSGPISWKTVPDPAQAAVGGAGAFAGILGSAAWVRQQQQLDSLILDLGDSESATRTKAQTGLRSSLGAALDAADVTRVRLITDYLKAVSRTTQDAEVQFQLGRLLKYAESYHAFQRFDAARLRPLSAVLGGAILGTP